jgi:hypothetical protein
LKTVTSNSTPSTTWKFHHQTPFHCSTDFSQISLGFTLNSLPEATKDKGLL